MRRLAAAELVAIPLACALLAAGCSAGEQTDELQVVSNPVAATAAVSPAPVAAPAGTVLTDSGPGTVVTAAVTTARTLAVAVQDPPSVRLYNLDDLTVPARSIPLPGQVERITGSGNELLASLPAQHRLARINLPGGQVTEVPVAGQPASARDVQGQTLVALRDRKAVEVLAADGPPKDISGQLYSADDVFDTGNGTLVLDRLRTALFAVDLAGGKVGEGLRAGDGAANATTDSYGRVLVTDARGGSLLAFSADPLLLRQRYPVPGGIYGIAYDAKRSLAWVTLTERNEVVGYDIRGGEPVEKHRFPTIRQPNTVTVDEQTARVVVGSAAGEGIQVIQP
ncbi:YncE family protein [Amycolatopsis nigrescens]|uniref:YncE family protein n=1 Tax=Amycolatopsis nigrescens TaxID=381445 RepID=UPI00037F5A39|nr:hypothetical protein [Amycolatopsis nigrescens]